MSHTIASSHSPASSSSIASPPAEVKKKAKAGEVGGSGTAVKAGPADAFDIHSAGALLPNTPVSPSSKAATLPGVRETFPVAALQGISGKGRSGETFLLDGGSLRGMKLQARRVKDGETPGLDLTFRVGGKELTRLGAAMKKAGAAAGPLRFRGTEVGEGGLCRYTTKVGEVSEDSSYAPSDMGKDDKGWTQRLEGKHGGSVEIAGAGAAYAARGLVRIALRGDDAKCSEQLQGFLKGLGMQHLFAPPTAKGKERFLRMRALWQSDHETANKLGRADLEALKPADVDKKLKSAGFDEERIAGLRFADVTATHFTAVDPGQAKAMVAAGARYLYSTVETIEHVCSILDNGQKSSLRRYQDGLIIDGMSTNEDLCSGGGAGVFTRLVTENAILDGGSWTGRRFKVVLEPEVLARTDWFGWPDDKFGQAWGLTTKKNFGLGLLKSIDGGPGSYESYNELIFRDSIGPQYIARIVATNASDRLAMIDELKKRGFTPKNGVSVEDFVVNSKTFMPYGPPAYDASDPVKFAAEALDKAKKKDTTPLRWFLMAGPPGEAKADLEAKILTTGSEALRELLFDSVKRRGTFEIGAERWDEILPKLRASKKPADVALLDQLVSQTAGALLASNSSEAASFLEARNKKAQEGYSYYGAFGIQPDAWVEILQNLAAKQAPGEKSPAFQLALDLSVERLLQQKHAGFATFLEKYPLVSPKDPEKFVEAEVKKLEAGKASTDLGLFLAQAKTVEEVGAAQLRLLEAGGPKAAELLGLTLSKFGAFGAPGPALAKVIKGLADQSKTRQMVLQEGQKALAKTGEASLLALLEKRWSANSYNSSLYEDDWLEVVRHYAEKGESGAKGLRWSLEQGIDRLLGGHSGEGESALFGILSKADLFHGDPQKLAKSAAAELGKKDSAAEGKLKLAWLTAQSATGREAAFGAILSAHPKEPDTILDWILGHSPDKAIPVSAEKLGEIAKDLAAGGKAAQPMLSWLMRNGAKTLLAKGNAAAIDVVKAFEKENGTYSLGLGGDAWLGVFEQLGSRKDAAAKSAKLWLLERFGKGALGDEDGKAVAAFRAEGVKPKDLGLDKEQAADKARELFEDALYEHDNNDSKEKMQLPAGVRWLIEDPAILTVALEKLPEWQENSGSSWVPFADALTDVPSDLTKKVASVKKKLKENAP